MFDNLSDRLGNVFDRLKGRGALSESDVREAMREIRIALLEADVALPVVRRFIDAVTEKAIGQDVLKSVTPGQQVVKIVDDELVDMLGGTEVEGLNFAAKPPVVIMMVGLQGSGKTTTTAKLGKLIRQKHGKKALMASLDVNRPAAQEQLKVLGEQVEVATLPIIEGQQPVDIARRAMESAKLQAADVLLLDTAGRLHVDEALMAEMKAIAGVSTPTEVLLVVDSLTGQDAVNVAQSFTGEVPLTGVVLTRMDGDARGGAALSMRYVTGKPIKFAGTGEKLDAIEAFDPRRVAGRILGMGDVVSLVEKAAESIKQDEAEALAKKMAQGQFDLDDLRMQLKQMQNMGGLGMLAGMLPGMKKAKAAMAASNMDDRVLLHMDAIIGSMTPKERTKPALLNAKRKKRVAAGSGTDVQTVNKVLKMHQEMGRAMKQIKKMGGMKGLGALFGGGGMGAAMPGLGGPGSGAGGLPGMGGGKGPGVDPSTLPPDLQNLLKKK
ncbi:MAG: signal recognition particle protein [Erythrobacter sp.]|jgi:signal recognition particle subunit SRP54|uniref:signal recognition particle protein n=1 Tax=Qipengyuania TaxID=1855416 RepID=UPI001A4FAC29|nr:MULTISPECIES: signal recognition particle protein [Qipengyuania]MBL4717237.1 signal recognition particle protein [Erythrobacter sp.]MCP2016250.1 signal recognition particle subunit SRP54 [Qipengyuania citrea]MDE0900318.1 signal recognition particle protein [Erythrobacter sp.]WPL55727.1 signal recognition particle protein [Qipengyuania sp. HL-TH5]|tara:strand:- start:66648 stop:68129 length:1482 start_codon:yes stop_codon:yes gene_type:complete